MANIDISKYTFSRKGDFALLKFLEKCAAHLQTDFHKSLKQGNDKITTDTKILLDKCLSLQCKVSNADFLDDSDIDTLQILLRYSSLKRKELFLIVVLALVLSVVSFAFT